MAELNCQFVRPDRQLFEHRHLLGYDAGKYIMEGLLQYGDHFGIQDITVPHYQSAIRFVRPDGVSGGYVNGNILFIHYRTDRTIEKLEMQ